jgi:hypothetical protein
VPLASTASTTPSGASTSHDEALFPLDFGSEASSPPPELPPSPSAAPTSAMPLLPTPAASLVNDGENVANWEARRERVKASKVNGNGMGTPLTIAAQRLAPGESSAPPSTDGRE